MKLKFRNRIALYYMLATAIIIAVVFSLLFFIVQHTMYENIDRDLSYEAHKHTFEITVAHDSIYFFNKEEWAEQEHREVQLNPVFVQVIDSEGRLMDKSPNLKDEELSFHQSQKAGDNYNTYLKNRPIRQVQVPLYYKGKFRGYIIAAMSLENSRMVITKLRNVLLISFPIVLIGLFFISRYLAGKNIEPIKDIISTTRRITKKNLNERVVLPTHQDELYKLSASINELLERIESAMQRERQFTSDASHELRTPLASLKGNLEVLVRKPRTAEEYEFRIKQGLQEIDRMSDMVEQLLVLARLEEKPQEDFSGQVSLVSIIDDILGQHAQELRKKNLHVNFNFEEAGEVLVPAYYTKLIFENLISNAIKYSRSDTWLRIHISRVNGHITAKITDQGIGIRQEDLENLFQPFFRSEALKHKEIKGTGLGLSITKKAAEAIKAHIEVESVLGKGTTFTVGF